MVSFPRQIQDCDSHSPALVDLLISSEIVVNKVYVLQWLSLHWEILIMLSLSFHWLSIKPKGWCHLSLHSIWLFLCWLGQSSWSFFFFLIGIHSMQGWTATMRHGFTRKRSTKRLKHTANLFRKNLQLRGVC